MFAARLVARPVKNRVLTVQLANYYVSGYWPEPLSQQSLADFLHDINYFQEPKAIVDIGLKRHQIPDQKQQTLTTSDARHPNSSRAESNPPHQRQHLDTEINSIQDIEKIIDLLGKQTVAPPLDEAHIRLSGKQLAVQAFHQGIYRDLFGQFTPNRDHIKFTKQQAENLNKLVPYHWITDQPFARVSEFSKQDAPLFYFEPLVNISARFIHADPQDASDCISYTSYCGNFIDACNALEKPSITLDGMHLTKSCSSKTHESEFDNWSSGQVRLFNFPDGNEKESHYYTIALLNLDYLHDNSANLHWMLTNIQAKNSSYDEICDYLPVHGIRGFGYSRYVFLLLQHDAAIEHSNLKIDNFSLEARRFDAKKFLDSHSDINMLPIGLSWFQTTWDETSNHIFHNYLNLKAPVYDHVQAKYKKPDPQAYPGRLPFNIFMDHSRDEKAINKQVLLERLKSVDITNYRDQFAQPKVPPTIHLKHAYKPSWLHNVEFKKFNKIGYWRGLRPASAILPLDNNADLDYPLRPIASSKKAPPHSPNLYPGNKHLKMHKNLPTSKPVNEFKDIFIQDDHEIHIKKAGDIASADK